MLMKHTMALGLLVAAALAAAPVLPQAEKSQVAKMSLKVGETAPEFTLLSDMNRKMLKTYGILKGYNVQDETYEWALRANIVIDKQGVIQLIDEGDSAVDPNTALTMCTTLHKKAAAK